MSIHSGSILPISAYSSAATRRAVLGTIFFDNPSTLYPPAVGLPALAFVTLVLDFPVTSAAGIAAMVLAGAGLLSLANDLLRRQSHLSGRYLAGLRQEQERQFADRTQRLGRSLRDLGFPWAAEQVERILGQFQAFRTVLDQKLKDPTRPLYNRYLGPAQSLALTAIDHLENVETLLQSVAPIDKDKIEQRLQQLGEGGGREAESLSQQLEIRERTLERVQTMIAETEEIIQTLVRTGDELAKTDQKDLESTMLDFLAIAERNQQMIADLAASGH